MKAIEVEPVPVDHGDETILKLTSDTKILTFRRNFLEIITLSNWQKVIKKGPFSSVPNVIVDDPGVDARFRECRVVPRFEFAGATLTREVTYDTHYSVSIAEASRKLWTLRLHTIPIKEKNFDAATEKYELKPCCYYCSTEFLVAACCPCIQQYCRPAVDVEGEVTEEAMIQTVEKPDMEIVNKWIYDAIDDSTHRFVHKYTHLFKAGLISAASPSADFMLRK